MSAQEWQCAYCGRLNLQDRMTCDGCGAGKHRSVSVSAGDMNEDRRKYLLSLSHLGQDILVKEIVGDGKQRSTEGAR